MLPGAGFYRGSEPEFLRSNVLFRLGGAGVVLSSRLVDCLPYNTSRLNACNRQCALPRMLGPLGLPSSCWVACPMLRKYASWDFNSANSPSSGPEPE